MDISLDFSGVVAFFTSIWDWINSGIYSFFTEAFASLVEWMIIAKLKSTIWAITFSWDIGKTVISDLNVSGYISSGWSMLPPEIRDFLVLFRIPEAIVNLLTSMVARFVFRFVSIF